MTELRTLKNLMVYGNGFAFKKSKKFPYPMFREIDLKQEAIKWVKEDIKNTGSQEFVAYRIIHKWMERLSVTEEDLK